MDLNLLSKEAISKNDINILLKVAKNGKGVASKYKYMDNFQEGFVYFLIKNNVVIYIGQSQSIARLGQHRKDKDYDTFAWIISNKHFYEAENALIHHFKPIHNKCFLTKSKKNQFTTSIRPDMLEFLKKESVSERCHISEIIEKAIDMYRSEIAEETTN